jgi:hypothetical protein
MEAHLCGQLQLWLGAAKTLAVRALRQDCLFLATIVL